MEIEKNNLKKNVIKTTPEPLIFTIDDFCDDATCEHFISLAKNRLQNALVSDNSKGYVSKGRTGKNCWISHNTDNITLSIGEKIAKQVGLPLKNAEAFQVIYYDKTQEYKQHYDGWNHDASEKSIRCMKWGGQRMITALCYLNTVPKGGGTKFTRLNTTVDAIKGRVLVFHNVLEGTNKKHPLSEHAGLPVIEGEKWAFNLWFREDDRKKIVYNPTPLNTSITNSQNVTSSNISNDIKQFDNLIDDNLINKFKSCLEFKSDTERSSVWLKNTDHSLFIKKISEITKTDPEYYDNLCFVQYPKNHIHRNHFDCFCTETSDKAIKEKMGQRLKTIAGFLDDNIEYKFPEINKTLNFKKGSVILYNNTLPLTNKRNPAMTKIITNKSDENVILFYTFVRERPRNTNYVAPTTVQPKTETKQNSIVHNPNNENYLDTLELVYNTFNTNKPARNGLKSLNFSSISTRKGWPEIVDTVQKLYKLKQNNSILNQDNLTKKYTFDEFNPIIIEKTINDDAIKLIGDYYYNSINSGFFELGDRQSNRYKSRNDPITRMLQYELLPLVECFTGKKMKPTYTYLSCYIKDADLPAHTDQADCEYTCSYILKKPKNTSWNIWCHLKKQPVKFKGRYNFTPPESESFPCDCEEGGLMCFNGTDHIHWRTPLEHEYYYVALLHYRTLDNSYV